VTVQSILFNVAANASVVVDFPVPGGPRIQPRRRLSMIFRCRNLNCSANEGRQYKMSGFSEGNPESARYSDGS
jgi:aspartate carbamoyltransferase regulatory subunit